MRRSYSLEEIVAILATYCLDRYHGTEPVELRIRLEDGQKITLPFPRAARSVRPPPATATEPAEAAPDTWASGPLPKHTSDFQRVYWPGPGEFILSRKRAKVVEALWIAWEAGVADVAQRALLDAASSDCARLADLFKDDPAWGQLIVWDRRGFYHLPPLTTEADDE